MIEQFKQPPDVVGSNVIIGALTYCACFIMCDLKAAHMNVQCCLIQELTLHEFEVRSGWTKTVDSKAMFQALEPDPTSGSRRISGELGIAQSSVIRHIPNLGKSIRNCRIIPHVPEILQNF